MEHLDRSKACSRESIKLGLSPDRRPCDTNERTQQSLAEPPGRRKSQAESILSFTIALIGGFVVPVKGFVEVLRYALTHVIHITEGVLSFHVALICRSAIPTESLPVVLRYPLAVVVHQSECVLGEGVSLLGSNMAGPCILNELFLNASIVYLPDERYSTGRNDANNRNNYSPR